jgi:hypothetical protein|tara:strand:+ start:807 stop:1493 length:687 start_codon:yes stop_codon:yes gene_type:complete
MAKYAKGKKSYAISDRGGQRVRYTQLKTTWDGLRVAPDEWEPKQPQLTPAKNIIDAQQLFQPRSTGQNQEDVVIYLAHTFDPFLPVQERPPIGCPGHGFTGSIDRIDFEAYPEVTGQAGTGAVGTLALELSINEAGVAGTGGVGVEVPVVQVTGVSGGGGSGNVGVEALNLSILESGVAGTGGVGAEVPQVNVIETGVAGTGGVGNATGVVVNQEWGSGTWNDGTWGN